MKGQTEAKFFSWRTKQILQIKYDYYVHQIKKCFPLFFFNFSTSPICCILVLIIIFFCIGYFSARLNYRESVLLNLKWHFEAGLEDTQEWWELCQMESTVLRLDSCIMIPADCCYTGVRTQWCPMIQFIFQQRPKRWIFMWKSLF